jgi:hypothetical protein
VARVCPFCSRWISRKACSATMSNRPSSVSGDPSAW